MTLALQKNKSFFLIVLLSLSFGYLISLNPTKTILFLVGCILLYFSAKNLYFALILIFCTTIFGQLLRFQVPFMGGGIQVLDIIIAFTVFIFLFHQIFQIKSKDFEIDIISRYLILFWAISLFSLSLYSIFPGLSDEIKGA